MTAARALQALSAAVSMGIFMMPATVSAGDLSLIRTVYFEHGSVVDPNAIAHTHDNGFIVAGTSEGKGWAIKVDAEGNLKWRYVISPINKPAHFNPFTDSPIYNSVVAMQDDGVLLCGSMPGLKNGSALLTHLDTNGKVLSEHFGLNNGGFSSCVASNNGIVAIGVGATIPKLNTHPTQRQPTPYTQEVFHRVSFIGINGKVKWEKIIPASEDIGTGDNISPLLPVSDGGFVFAASRNTIGTEVVHVGPDGDVEARKVLAMHDAFTVVQPTEGVDNSLQLISMGIREAPLSVTLLTLDSDLKEVARKTQFHTPGVTYGAYRQPDQSLVLFGYKNLKAHPTLHSAHITKLDPTLRHEETLDLAPNRESYWTKACVRGKKGEFVCARRAILPPKPGEIFCRRIPKGAICDEEKMKQSRLGVALDFIKVH